MNLFNEFKKMPIINYKIRRLTPTQIKYIEQLSIALTLSHSDRNEHISEQLGREIRYLDEMSFGEASKIINFLKEWKEGN